MNIVPSSYSNIKTAYYWPFVKGIHWQSSTPKCPVMWKVYPYHIIICQHSEALQYTQCSCDQTNWMLLSIKIEEGLVAINKILQNIICLNLIFIFLGFKILHRIWHCYYPLIGSWNGFLWIAMASCCKQFSVMSSLPCTMEISCYINKVSKP